MNAIFLSVERLFALVLRELAGDEQAPAVVWEEGADALELRLDTLAVVADGGWLQVSLTTRCDALGEATLAVAFYLGRPERGDGPHAAAALAPSSDPQVGARWGAALRQAVWNALLDAIEADLAEREQATGRPLEVVGFVGEAHGVGVFIAEVEASVVEREVIRG